MSPSVGYLEAWGLWWRGVDLKPMALYGLSMLWVGRIAKIVTFMAGFVAFLDVAEEKARRLAASFRSQFPIVLIAGVIAEFVIELISGSIIASEKNFSLSPLNLFLIGAPIAIFVLLLLVSAIVLGVVTALESRFGKIIVRSITITMLAAGFSFDLLTS